MRFHNMYLRRFNTRKLTFEQAEEIRKQYEDGGITQRELAEEYNVSQYVIHSIIAKKSYTHNDPNRRY